MTAAGDALRLAATWALRLAWGRPDDERLPQPDWQLVLEVALAERLLPLAWERGGAVVRARAGELVPRWRSAALQATIAAERQASVTAEVVGALSAAGVDTIVLRGAGLAMIAFGAPMLRPSGDVDLFMSTADWPRADALLRERGWARNYGEPPREVAYHRATPTGVQVLELHFALADGALVRHLELPLPFGRQVEVAGRTVRAHDDAILPAYLALHAAKHGRPPLLWFVELGGYWRALDRERRRAAFTAAAAHRCAGYLRWALVMASACERAGEGDTLALRELGFQGAGRGDDHHAWRLARFAARPLDAARVLVAWALPADSIASPRRLLALAVGRVAKLLGITRRGATTPEYGADRPPAAPASGSLAVEGRVGDAVRTVVDAGGSLWIRATGESMRPAIEPGTMIRLAPATSDSVSSGSVVLARVPDGRSVLHRVRTMRDGRLELQGDNALASDPPIARGDVIAVATDASVDGTVIPISRRRRGTLLRLRRRAGRLVRRVIPGNSGPPEVRP